MGQVKRNEMVYKVSKTVLIALGRVFMGLYLELVGPSLTDLQGRLGVSYEPISRCLAAKSVGYFLGAIAGGLLLDRFPSKADLLLSVAFLLGGVGTVATPWGRELYQVGMAMHLQGIGEGMIDTGGDTTVFRLWGDKSAAPIGAMHFGFGIGAFSAPFLAGPFLAPDTRNETSSFNSIQTFTTTPSVETTQVGPIAGVDYWTASEVQIPYAIAGALTASMSIVMLFFFIVKPPRDIKMEKPGKTFSELFSPAACAGGNTIFGVQMFAVIFLFYMAVVGGERAYGKFISAFARNTEVDFSKDEATYLTSVFWGCFLAARGLAMLLFPFTPPTIMLIVLSLMSVASSIVLLIYGHYVRMVLWVFTGVFGLLLSPTFPAGQAWGNLYMKLKGMAVAIIYIGSACGGFLFQWLTGYLLDTYGQKSLMYVIFGYSCALTLIVGAGIIVTRGWKHICTKEPQYQSAEQDYQSSDGRDKVPDYGGIVSENKL